jgi:hypothetical protein
VNACSLSSCEGVLPKLNVVGALLSTGGELLALEGGHLSAVSASLLLSQVVGKVS